MAKKKNSRTPRVVVQNIQVFPTALSAGSQYLAAAAWRVNSFPTKSYAVRYRLLPKNEKRKGYAIKTDDKETILSVKFRKGWQWACFLPERWAVLGYRRVSREKLPWQHNL